MVPRRASRECIWFLGARRGTASCTQVHTFAVPVLYDKIVGATHKVKANKVVITLKKPADSKFKWYDLKK